MAEQETIVLGIVGIKNCGVYDPQTNYEKLNVVTYQGSSYCALKSTLGTLPTDTDYWQLYAEKGGKGDTGDTGPQGPKPVKGVDYYTQEDKAEISDEIATDVADEVSLQIGNLTSATPLAASSISDMIDTTRIYVNTSDGKWYYYDGDSWEIGGTYQSTGIADGSVTFENLESDLQNTFVPNYTNTIAQPTKDKIISTTGSETAGSNYGYYELDVNPFDTYKVQIYLPDALATSSYVRTMFKYNTTVISYTTGDSVPERENYYYEEIINIPYNVNKLIINCGGVNNQASKNYIIKVDNYKENNISINQLDNQLKAFFNGKFTEITPTLFVDQAYIQNNGNLTSYSSAKIYKVLVNPHEIYRFKLKQIYANPAICLGFSNNSYTYTLNEVTYTLNNIYPIKDEESGHQFTDYLVEIPSWCNVIYFNKSNSDSSFKIEKLTGYKVDVDDLDIPDFNPLNNKTLCFAGDSVMAASTTGVKGWVGIMSENNPTANFYNYGHDGYTIAKAEDSWSSRSIQNVLPTMLSEHPTPDYIIFQGGINDIYGADHGITLGEILSGYDTTNVDRTSFTGGMEYIINYLYTNFPKTKVAYIVNHQIYSNNFVPFMERAIQVCKKWSVPIINLMEEGNLNFKITYMRTNYSLNSDGIHPNLDGYKIETPFIENAIKYKL